MLTKCFLVPGFDPPHNQYIFLFRRYGNEQVTNPPCQISRVGVCVGLCGYLQRPEVKDLPGARVKETCELPNNNAGNKPWVICKSSTYS